MTKAQKYNTPPTPIDWVCKNTGCDHYICKGSKRNYTAVTHEVDGDRFKYTIYETSTGTNVMILYMEASSFPYDIDERAQQLLRSYAKGYTPGLNQTELALLEVGEYAEHYPERAIFIPYTKHPLDPSLALKNTDPINL